MARPGYHLERAYAWFNDKYYAIEKQMIAVNMLKCKGKRAGRKIWQDSPSFLCLRHGRVPWILSTSEMSLPSSCLSSASARSSFVRNLPTCNGNDALRFYEGGRTQKEGKILRNWRQRGRSTKDGSYDKIARLRRTWLIRAWRKCTMSKNCFIAVCTITDKCKTLRDAERDFRRKTRR